jgi:ADP-dependent NAD(P)H-hydrate dehydratase / NAD(P)H-hydrate epimerase
LPLPVEIYSVETVRAIDRAAIGDAGISGYALMTRAAEAALLEARATFPDAGRWQVICGAGNNAGDGYVLARLAALQGIDVSVLAMVPPQALSGDAAIAYRDFVAEGGQHLDWQGALDADATLLVDALLGSGLDRAVGGQFADVVGAINAHPGAVLALDIPAGIHGDTGQVLGVAIRADLTVTFVGLKSGLFLGDAPDYVGALKFCELGIPVECRADRPVHMRRIDDTLLRKWLTPRKRNAHKGDFGHLVVAGGGPGMPGAIALCGAAALRSGAGRVSVATHPDHHAAIAATCPELMSHAVSSAADLDRLLQRASTLVIGPGLGQSDWAKELFSVAMHSGLPLVVDADALTLLADSDVRHGNWVLTPHPGEAGRLLQSSAREVQQQRLSALNELQQQYGGTVVLKGVGSLVSAADGTPWLCTDGNPGMAAPGMGDVLAGVIAALLAQGLPADVAAAIGVTAHARAGDLAAAGGERGLMASDLIPGLRQAVNPVA